MSGLEVLATAVWPDVDDTEAPRLAGFIHSDFNPIVAAVAGRCLGRSAPDEVSTVGIVLVSELGDADSAAHVAHAVDTGGRIGPLFFFQSVPNAVLGHVAARHGLTGPVTCVGDPASGRDVARGLLADGDADRVLLIELDGAGAAATLLTRRTASNGGPS